MLVLLGVLERHVDSATHIVTLIEHGQLDLILATTDLVVLLIGQLVELDIDLDAAGQASEERGQLLLSQGMLTIATVNKNINIKESKANKYSQ